MVSTTYFVAVGASTTAMLTLNGPGGMQQLAKIEGDLGFVPVVGGLLTFPNSKSPGVVFKVQSFTGEGYEQVKIVRVVRTSQTGPNVQSVG